jgi:hypothetical protein
MFIISLSLITSLLFNISRSTNTLQRKDLAVCEEKLSESLLNQGIEMLM